MPPSILVCMLGALGSAVRFFWLATAGHRLTPWRSPYLRWRLETYTGKKAETLTIGDFLRLGWAERRQLLVFFRWSGELRALAREKMT